MSGTRLLIFVSLFSLLVASGYSQVTQSLSVPSLVRVSDYFSFSATLANTGDSPATITVNLTTSGVDALLEGEPAQQELSLEPNETRTLEWQLDPLTHGSLTVTLSTTQPDGTVVTSESTATAYSQLVLDSVRAINVDERNVFREGASISVSLNVILVGANYDNATVTATLNGVQTNLSSIGTGAYSTLLAAPLTSGLYYIDLNATDNNFPANKGSARQEIYVVDEDSLVQVPGFPASGKYKEPFEFFTTIYNWGENEASVTASLETSSVQLNIDGGKARSLAIPPGRSTSAVWSVTPLGYGDMIFTILYSGASGRGRSHAGTVPVDIGMEATRTVEASESETRVTIRVYNPSNDIREVNVTEVIPKELAANASQVSFDNPAPLIVEEDPKVRWSLTMQPSETRVFSYKTSSVAAGAAFGDVMIDYYSLGQPAKPNQNGGEPSIINGPLGSGPAQPPPQPAPVTPAPAPPAETPAPAGEAPAPAVETPVVEVAPAGENTPSLAAGGGPAAASEEGTTISGRAVSAAGSFDLATVGAAAAAVLVAAGFAWFKFFRPPRFLISR